MQLLCQLAHPTEGPTIILPTEETSLDLLLTDQVGSSIPEIHTEPRMLTCTIQLRRQTLLPRLDNLFMFHI